MRRRTIISFAEVARRQALKTIMDHYEAGDTVTLIRIAIRFELDPPFGKIRRRRCGAVRGERISSLGVACDESSSTVLTFRRALEALRQ